MHTELGKLPVLSKDSDLFCSILMNGGLHYTLVGETTCSCYFEKSDGNEMRHFVEEAGRHFGHYLTFLL